MDKALYQANIGDRSVPATFDLAQVDWSGGLLIRSVNWLGDVVMSLPGMYRLRQQLPEGIQCRVVCSRKLAPLWNCVPWVDDVVSFGGRRIDPQTAGKLKELSPDVTVILPNSFGSAWDLCRARLPHRIGRRGRGRTLFLNHCLPEYRRTPGQDDCHQARHYLEFATMCGSDAWDTDCPALSTAPMDDRLRGLLPDGEKPLLVVAPGAAYGPAKQWPTQHFRDVVDWWCGEIGRAVAIGAPGEEEAAEESVAGIADATALAGKTSLAELCTILAEARCVVANDSGAMHLASALKRDGVALFGSTDPIATGPIGGRWIVLQYPVDCAPCLKRTCRREERQYECLREISAQDAIDSLKKLLET